MKKIAIRIIFILSLVALYSTTDNIFAKEEIAYGKDATEQIRVVGTEQESHKLSETDEHAAHDGEGHGEHGTDMSPLFFVIVSLFIGTAIRHFLHKFPVPYTVLLILIGIGLGVLDRMGYLGGFSISNLHINLDIFSRSITWAGNIDPHLVLFVFLPTLIFEAAFNMDVHTFKKSFWNSFILAVPGISFALVLTACLMMLIVASGMGLEKWNWFVALMFGALISATDPVSVVALLKELGASKKLSTLIEGESLLNDGTAIVFFMVFFMLIAGMTAENSPVVEFLRVALGGSLIGFVIGWILISWLQKVFNDPLFEITVIVSGAYLTFFIAESFFHVSGVLGLVALGIYMAGKGKTKISPEVSHFLHEFWELAAFIANTLIFLIVGVVIALRTVFTSRDILLLFILYFGLLVVRSLMIIVFFPLMKRLGYGLPVKNAIVLWWGGLRGAIALALALVVASHPSISEDIRNQVLFLTAGIVVLTSIINATTTSYLIKILGLTKLSPAQELMIKNNLRFCRKSSEKALSKIKTDRFMSGANWEKVEQYLPKAPDLLDEQELSIDSLAETRKRVLQKEKSSYWEQFEEGLLGSEATHELSDSIDVLLDSEGQISLSNRADLEYLWKTPKTLNILQSWPLIGSYARNYFFNKLAISYDCAKGFVLAQDQSLKLLNSMVLSTGDEGKLTDRQQEILEQMESEINENRIQGLTFLRNLRDAFPEIYSAIETRQAIRSLLNHQRNVVYRLLKERRIEQGEASVMLGEIEEKMEKLMNTPPSTKVLLPIEMLKEVRWLAGLDTKIFNKIVALFQNRIYAVGEDIVKKKKFADDLFIIVRGSAKVIINKTVRDMLGPGDTIGEMALLANIPRTATVTAESPVTALRMPAHVLQKLVNDYPVIGERLWKLAGERFAENSIIDKDPYKKMSTSDLRYWLWKGEVITVKKNEILELKEQLGILLSGSVANAVDNQKIYTEPGYIDDAQIIALQEAKIFVRKLQD